MTNPTRQPTTVEWAISLGISTAPIPPTVENYDEPCPFSARQIATRAVILQGVFAALIISSVYSDRMDFFLGMNWLRLESGNIRFEGLDEDTVVGSECEIVVDDEL